MGEVNRHFKVVMAGYNCFNYLERSLQSVLDQDYDNYEVCVVDDASTDKRQPKFVEDWCEKHGWKYILRTSNAGALVSQLEAIKLLDPKDGDVLVWVDADDRLAHSKVLTKLDQYYTRSKCLMTYGSYESDPPDPGCSPAQRYPRECEKDNDYRDAYKWGIQFNHLRTISWDLFKHLDEIDFRDSKGRYFSLSADFAFMIPCLELAGGRYKCIKETLYIYSSDNPISEWRKAAKQTNKVHDFMIRHIPKKQPLVLV